MKKSIRHLIEYTLLRFLQGIATFLPRPSALKLGSALGHLLYNTGVYRRTVRRNMEHVDLWDAKEMDVITRKLYRMMGRYAIDFLRVDGTSLPYRVDHVECLDEVIARGRGTIVLLGHFGNWEILANLFGSKVPDLRVVAKPMRNPLVDKWLTRKRDATKVTTIFVDQALRKIYEGIKENALIAVLIDQNAGSQGTQIPFLGKEASTVRTVAGMVHKTGCSVLPCYALMGDDGSYDIHIAIAPAVDLSAGGSGEEAIVVLQTQHNDILSEWIRNHPEHWFGWFHRRWREHVNYD